MDQHNIIRLKHHHECATVAAESSTLDQDKTTRART